MRLSLTIKFADGTDREVNAGPADFVAFERKYNVSAINFEIPDMTTYRVEWLYFLGWSALVREDPKTTEFEKWVVDLDDVGATRNLEEAAVPPTEPATPQPEESPVSEPVSA